MKSLSCCSILFLLVFSCISTEASDKAFRVDNIIQGAGRSPEVKSSAFFLQNGNFISLIGDNGEIIFYDATSELEKFVLLDPVLRIQTHLDVGQTKENVKRLQQRNKDHDEPLFAFVAQPNFQQEKDRTGDISLQSPWFDYRLETELLSDKEILDRYFGFCDMSCYLNYRLNPSSPIPLVRLAVNEILRSENRFPKVISMSFHPKGKGFFQKEEKIKSSHKIISRLDESDHKKIDQVYEYMRSFNILPFDEYQKKIAVKSSTK